VTKRERRVGSALETCPNTCAWCGRKFEAASGPGRPRLYCRTSCRQRDYEARRRAAELGLGEHELVVTRKELERLRDRLYLLQCAVDDVERELDDTDDTERALASLLDAAKHAVT
jgi:hypothetical protein